MSCEPLTSFTDYHAKFPPKPGFLGQVNAVVLRQAVQYVALFAKKHDDIPTLNCVSLREGVFYGGFGMQLGAIEAPDLRVGEVTVKFESIKTLARMLARFEPDHTTLWITDTYYIIKDDAAFFGFERYPFSFKDVAELFQGRSDNHVMVDRKELLNSLTLLAAVEKKADRLVEVTVPDKGGSTQLHLKVVDHLGRTCSDWVRAARRYNAGQISTFPPWQFSVPLEVFLRVLNFFDLLNAWFEVIELKHGGALYIYDELGQLTARTLLDFMTPEQTERLTEQKLQMRRP